MNFHKAYLMSCQYRLHKDLTKIHTKWRLIYRFPPSVKESIIINIIIVSSSSIISSVKKFIYNQVTNHDDNFMSPSPQNNSNNDNKYTFTIKRQISKQQSCYF